MNINKNGVKTDRVFSAGVVRKVYNSLVGIGEYIFSNGNLILGLNNSAYEEGTDSNIQDSRILKNIKEHVDKLKQENTDIKSITIVGCDHNAGFRSISLIAYELYKYIGNDTFSDKEPVCNVQVKWNGTEVDVAKNLFFYSEKVLKKDNRSHEYFVSTYVDQTVYRMTKEYVDLSVKKRTAVKKLTNT